jgi:transcriptional regulator with XRE-family HTH domain
MKAHFEGGVNMEKMERVATTPERLKEALRDARMKPIELAKKAGLNHSTISRYLSGAVEPRQEAAHKIAQALGVSELWLWGYNVPKIRTEAQKKNDDLVQVIVKLRKDPDFFEVVSILAGLDQADYASIKQLVSALGEK